MYTILCVKWESPSSSSPEKKGTDPAASAVESPESKITEYFKPSRPSTPNRRPRPRRFALTNYDEDWCRDTGEPVPSVNLDYTPTVDDAIDYDTLLKARKEEFNSIFIFNC